MNIDVGHITTNVRANGPGVRNVLHVAGCTLACRGCFNKWLWPSHAGRRLAVNTVADELLERSNGHFTFTGGEPLQQATALLELVEELERRAALKTLFIFTGYDLSEFDSEMRELVYGKATYAVAGRFNASLALHEGFATSSNQVSLARNAAGTMSVVPHSFFGAKLSSAIKVTKNGVTVTGMQEIPL